MSLKSTTTTGISVVTSTETEILNWTADGIKKFAGFRGTGEGDAEYRLYVGGVFIGSANANLYSPNAEWVDLPYIPASGTVFSLKVYHELGSSKYFGGCFLGN